MLIAGLRHVHRTRIFSYMSVSFIFDVMKAAASLLNQD